MEKDFDSWNIKKKQINKCDENFSPFFHEREVWFCSIGLNIGSEQDGKNELYERPVLIVKKFNLGLFLGVPLTSKIKSSPYCHIFFHSNKSGSVILSQLRCFDAKRLRKKLYSLPIIEYRRILENLRQLF